MGALCTITKNHVLKLRKSHWSLGNEHPTAILPLKTIRVDKKIVPVVKWLNGLFEVFTVWSCQGTPATVEKFSSEIQYDPPYVLFYCSCRESLDIIEQLVSRANKLCGDGIWLSHGILYLPLRPKGSPPSFSSDSRTWINSAPRKLKKRNVKSVNIIRFRLEFRDEEALKSMTRIVGTGNF